MKKKKINKINQTKKQKVKPYGQELILDMHGCDAKTFNRTSLRKYFKTICDKIKMTRCDLHFWDDVGVPKKYKQTSPLLKGTSAIQFIMTSNITIHTLDLLGAVYVNLFSCKAFDKKVAEKITKEWFKAKTVRSFFIDRI